MAKQLLIIESNEEDCANLLDKLSNLKLLNKNIYRCMLIEDAFLIPITKIDNIIIGLPFDGIKSNVALQLLHRHFYDIPILVLANNKTDEEKNINKEISTVWLAKNEYSVSDLEKAILKSAELKKSFFKVEMKTTNCKVHFYQGSVPMWIYDTESLQILEVNSAAIKTYGYTNEEFLTLSLIDLLPKEDIYSFLDTLENRESNQFDIGYWQNIKKDGEIFFVNIYTHFTIHNEKETGLSFAFDVSNKLLQDLNNKNSKNLIKGQREQFDSILSTLSDAVWSIRADTLELIYANQAFYKLFGFSPEEMNANVDPFFSPIHPEDQKLFRQKMQGVSYSGSAKVEYRYNHRDGNLRILQAHVTLIKGSEGKPDTLNGVTVDVTKERALQDKIRKSEQNLLATINNTKDLIWSVNSNLQIIFCNEPYQEFMYKLTSKIPKPGDFVLGDWGSETFINSRKEDYKRALEGEYFCTVREENFGGEILYKEFSNNPIIDHEGKIIGVNCIARDISEQRKQFMKIQEQNEKLIEIAWIQSHKVRSPVATILGLAELFDYEAQGNEHNCEILDMIKLSVNRLDDIIKEVVEKTEILGK